MSVIVRGWEREKLRKIRRRLGRLAFEHDLGQAEFSSCGKSGKSKFTTSSRSRAISASTKDSTGGCWNQCRERTLFRWGGGGHQHTSNMCDRKLPLHAKMTSEL